MKKFILRLDLHDDKEKRKAMKTVTMVPGIDGVTIDMKEKRMTLIGSVDPVSIVSKLRKYWPAELIALGPAKEPEKKEETKKEEAKKDEDQKKEEGKKEEEKKPAATTQLMIPPYMMPQFRQPYYNSQMYPYNLPPVYNPYQHQHPMMMTYHPQPSSHYYVQPSVEENPAGCVIV